MAGRPRTMVGKAEQFEVKAYELADAVFQAIPEQYRSQPDPDDWICQAWNDCLDVAIHLWTVAEDLAFFLREKAGLPEEGSTAQCRLIRKDRRRQECRDTGTPWESGSGDSLEADGKGDLS